MPELRTAQENVRLEIGSQRGRNSHQIGVLGIYDLRGLNYGRTELLVADMRGLLAPDPPSGTPRAAAVWGGASKRPYTHSLGMKVADKLSPLTPQPSPMGQGAVRWALGAILRWSPGARSFGTTRR